MRANESFKSCRVVTQIWLIRSKQAFSAKHSVLRRIDRVLRPPGAQASSRRLPTLQPRRLSKTNKLETLLLSDPSRVRVFRKIIDRQSDKPLFKPAKFKITHITDHFTDKEKVCRKNHVCLKPNFRNNISATQSTLGDRLQTPGPTSRGVGKRPVTRSSQSTLLEKRPDDRPWRITAYGGGSHS